MWQALYERRIWIAALTLLGLGSGVAVAVLVPARFAYTSVIDVGMNGNGQDRLEPVPEVLARLIEDYIPRGMQDYAAGHAGTAVPALSARQPAASGLLILESYGPAASAEVQTGVHAATFDLLRADHDAVLSRVRHDLEVQMAALRGQIQTDDGAALRLSELAKEIAASRARLEVTAAELRRELTSSAHASGSAPVGDASVVSVLVKGQDLSRMLPQLAAVETVLFGDTQTERRNVEVAIGDNRRRAAELRTQVDRLQLQLDRLRQTRAVSVARRSLGPSGRTPFMTVWMATTLGLACGLFLALWPVVLASDKGPPPDA